MRWTTKSSFVSCKEKNNNNHQQQQQQQNLQFYTYIPSSFNDTLFSNEDEDDEGDECNISMY
jgi:hypothetical protein